MQISVELPEELIHFLGEDPRTISRAALESIVADLARAGRMSAFQVQRVLGFSHRHHVDVFLKLHGVDLHLSVEQVISDSDAALTFSK